jgi:hypothetical protein
VRKKRKCVVATDTTFALGVHKVNFRMPQAVSARPPVRGTLSEEKASGSEEGKDIKI